MKRWTPSEVEQLRQMAAAGEYASVIAATIGVSHASILTMAGRNDIAVKRYTPAEQAARDVRTRAAEERKNAKRRGARGNRPTTAIMVAPMVNKTSPAYRNCLPRLPEMSKSELRAMLTEAVRNTAEASV